MNYILRIVLSSPFTWGLVIVDLEKQTSHIFVTRGSFGVCIEMPPKLGSYPPTETRKEGHTFPDDNVSRRWPSSPWERYSWVSKLVKGLWPYLHIKESEKGFITESFLKYMFHKKRGEGTLWLWHQGSIRVWLRGKP